MPLKLKEKYNYFVKIIVYCSFYIYRIILIYFEKQKLIFYLVIIILKNNNLYAICS